MERNLCTLEKTDDELIDSFINQNCEESFNVLLERHCALYCRITQKYISYLENKGVSAYEISGDKHFVFYKSIVSYSKNKQTKFSTWLAHHVRYHCLNTLNSTEKLILVENKDLTQFPDNRLQEQDLSFFDYIMQILDNMRDKRIKTIFVSRFLSGSKKKSWKLVAKETGLSYQQCINLYIRAKRFLRAKLDKPELLENL